MTAPVRRLAALVWRGFSRHEVFVRAAALTYVTILTLVPSLAVAFAIFAAMGGLARARDVLLPRLLDYIAVGARDTVATGLEAFLANIRGGTIGWVGTLFLVLSVAVLLSQIELAFTRIWEMPRGRSMLRRVAVYWTVVTFTPALVLGGMWLYATASRLAPVAWLVALAKPLLALALPFALVCLGFGLLYVFVPNERVAPRAAAAGALVAASLWLTAAYGYALYAKHAVFYSRIYGSLGALPILLVWIYVSWVVVLLGAEVTVGVERLLEGDDDPARDGLSPRARELMGVRLLFTVARRYLAGHRPGDLVALARELGVGRPVVAAVADDLVAAQLLLRTSDGRLVPALDPSRIAPGDVVTALRRLGSTADGRPDGVARELAALQEHAEEALRAAWSPRSLADLAS